MHFQCLDSISNHSFWKLLHFQHANLWTWSHQHGHLHNLHIWTELRYSNHWEKHQKYLLTFHLQGLTLILDLEQSNYMYNGLTKGAGVRIAVHDPKTWWCVYLGFLRLTLFLHRRGLPDEHGMEATPHFLTNFVMQETRSHSISLSTYQSAIYLFLSIYLSTYLPM